MTPRVLKIVGWSYLIKTLIVGAAWLMVPDLPERAAAKVRQAWTWAVGNSTSTEATVR